MIPRPQSAVSALAAAPARDLNQAAQMNHVAYVRVPGLIRPHPKRLQPFRIVLVQPGENVLQCERCVHAGQTLLSRGLEAGAGIRVMGLRAALRQSSSAAGNGSNARSKMPRL